MKIAALAVTLVEFVLSIPLFTSFAGGVSGMQFETKIPGSRTSGSVITWVWTA